MTDECAPIIILGNHRSGTTLLHLLMAETGCFDYVTAYHILAYDALPSQPACVIDSPAYRALVERFQRLGIHRRAADAVALGPSTPEEYGFILDNAGTGFRLTAANRGLFRQLCARIHQPAAGRRPVLLKNPWDFANFVPIKRLLPAARFLFVHRHPERVVHSSLQAARALLAEQDPYQALVSVAYARLFTRRGQPGLRLYRTLSTHRWALGARLLTRWVARANHYFVEHVGELAGEDYASIRYEDLCTRPETVIRDVLTFCGIDPVSARPPSTAIQARGGPVLPEVARQRAQIAHLMGPYMACQCYCPGA